MKSKVVALVLFSSTIIIGYSSTSFADICYDVGGTVTTENVTSNLQMGDIALTLSDSNGIAFSETGSLVGNITGTDGVGTTLLSHTARFSQGDSFVTDGDEAVLAFPYVRNTLEDGTSCSFWIHETISTIVKGTGFFKNVKKIQVFADGYISNCPGENENYFELSGELCVE